MKGGRIALPAEYFTGEQTGNYTEGPHSASSRAQIGCTNMLGPDLQVGGRVKRQQRKSRKNRSQRRSQKNNRRSNNNRRNNRSSRSSQKQRSRRQQRSRRSQRKSQRSSRR